MACKMQRPAHDSDLLTHVTSDSFRTSGPLKQKQILGTVKGALLDIVAETVSCACMQDAEDDSCV